MTNSWDTPVRSPPEGVTSNLINPSSIAGHATACNIVCAVVVIILVVLRMYTRIFVVKSVGCDDYICLLALFAWAATTGVFEYMEKFGLGVHLWNVSLADYSPGFLQAWVCGAIFYSTTIMCIKLSILALYRRLFPVGNFAARWWIVTIFTLGYSIGGIVSSLLTCTPISAAWDITITAEHCIDTAAFYITNGILNCISDLLILGLPIPIIWKLNLTLRKKITLSVIFALGSVSCIISIVRLKSVVVYLKNGDSDVTYDLVGIVFWSQIEMTVAMLCSCVPTIRPLFERYVGNLIHSTEPNSARDQTKGPYIKTVEGKAPQYGHYSRYSGGAQIELGIPNNHKSQTFVSTHRAVDSDVESLGRFNRRTPSICYSDTGRSDFGLHEEGRRSGIMVHTSYQVQSDSHYINSHQ